jgi:Holliday junction resolvase RusA-like endonuclease
VGGYMKIVIEGYQKVVSKKNKLKFSRRNGRAYKKKDVKDFENYIQQIAHEAVKEWQRGDCIAWPLDKDYKLSLEIVWGCKTKRDIQNAFDCICDALQGIIYKDDSQIKEIWGKKSYEKNKWWFKITVEVQ